jgi:hypothetical protein
LDLRRVMRASHRVSRTEGESHLSAEYYRLLNELFVLNTIQVNFTNPQNEHDWPVLFSLGPQIS